MVAGRKVLPWREEPCKGPEAGSVQGLILPFSQASGAMNESWAGPLRALVFPYVVEWSPCNPRRRVYSLSLHFTDVETEAGGESPTVPQLGSGFQSWPPHQLPLPPAGLISRAPSLEEHD